MARTRNIQVSILGDASDLMKAFRQAERSSKDFGRNMGRAGRGAISGTLAFQGLGRTVAFASGAFLGGAGLAAAVRTAFGEMSQAQQAAAQTAAALKSTGGVAGVTAKHIDELANSLLQLSGVDDEAIKGAENLLLTFTNVRNEAGKGNAIFDQATQAALDLSVRFKIDLAKAAVLVGKALNDPVRGMTALRRIGVSFTSDQVKLVGALVKSHRGLDAQKVILHELTVETGGAAKAFGETLPGRFAILNENVKNVAGNLAGTLAPQLGKIVDRVNKWVGNTKNQEAIQTKFNQIVLVTSNVFNRLRGIVEAVTGALGGWSNTLTILVGAWAGFKLAGITSAAAVAVANIAAAEASGVAWRAALVSTGFGVLAVAAGIAAAEVIAHWSTVKEWFAQFWLWLETTEDQNLKTIAEGFAWIPGKAGQWARDLKDSLDADIGMLQDQSVQVAQAAQEARDAAAKAKKAADAGVTPGVATVPGKLPPFKMPKMPPLVLSAADLRQQREQRKEQRNAWWDAMIGRLGDVQDLPLRQQLQRLQRVAKLVGDRLGVTRDITRRLTLEDKLRENLRSQKQVRQEIAQGFMDALQLDVDRAAATKTLRDDLVTLKALQQEIERRIRVEGATTDLLRQLFDVRQRIVGVGEEQKQRRKDAAQAVIDRLAFNVDKAGLTKTLTDDLAALLKQQAGIRKAIKQEGATLDLLQQQLDVEKKIRDKREEMGKARAPRFRHVSTTALLEELGLTGLTPLRSRQLRAVLAQIGPGMTRPAGRTPAFAGAAGVVVHGDIHLHGVQDVSKLENQLTKRANARAHQRRGSR